MAGRGRGRGRGALNFEALKKPGEDEPTPEGLLRRCVLDPKFATHAVAIATKQISGDGGLQYRATLLSLIQKHFKDKEVNREKDPTKFVGSMALLCQVFAKIRSADGAPLLPLINPVIEVLKLLMDESATNEEIECCSDQANDVIAVIKEAGKAYNAQLTDLYTSLRKVILEPRGSEESREKLLSGLEEICIILSKK